MRRIVAERGRPAVVDVDPPVCTPGRVLVKTIVSTVSAGTESAILSRSGQPGALDVEYPGEPPYRRPEIRRWMRSFPEPTPPLPGRFSLGYSLAGRVVEVGSDVPDISLGDIVACSGSQDAHHAEFVAVTRSLTAHVPRGVSPQAAAFVAPGGVAVEAIRRTDCRFGESVVIFGLGLLGLIAAQVARVAGLTVIGLEPSPERREVARSLGLDDVVDPRSAGAAEVVLDRTDGFGADAAVLAIVSDSSEPVNQALRLTRRGGRVVGVGVFPIDLERGAVFDRTYVHAIAFGAGRYDPWYEEGNVDYPIQHVRWTENRTMEYFLRLLAEGSVSVDGMAETFALGDAETAYARLSDPDRPYTVQFSY
ncbi:MAG TPA: zinc-binding alcohol dehydrogenase [Acidimicrobiia bacterium]|nr:zinc-binding alcohol dehydrogenase [Acidimicrobiia bacterium]